MNDTCATPGVTRLERPPLFWWAWGFLLLAGGVVVVSHVGAAWFLPVVFLPDSMDYAVSGVRALDSGTLESMGTWRVPGFPLIFAFFHGFMRNPASGIGLLNAACVIASAGLAGVIVGRVYGVAAAGVAVLLVGLDPVGFLYQQAVMPESLSTLFIVGIVAAVMGVRGDVASRRTCARTLALGVLFGVAVGLGCYLRPNLQVVVVWTACALGLVAWRTPLRGMVIGMGVLLAGGAVISPWVLRTHARTDRVSLVVGAGITRAISAVEVGALDLDQPGLLTATVVARVRAREVEGRLGPYDLIDVLTPLVANPDPDRRRAALDELCAELAVESARRHPGRHACLGARAFLNVSGLWIIRDTGYRENAWWARAWVEPMTQAGNHHVPADGYRELAEDEVRPIVNRTRASMPRVSGVVEACARAWWIGWEWGRAALAWLSLVGIVSSVRQGRVGLGAMLMLPLVHAGVMAGLTWAGIDRYGVPFYPVMVTGGVIGAAGAARWLITRQLVRE